MIALLRKDAPWLLFFMIIGVGLVFGLLLDLGLNQVWSFPGVGVFATCFWAWFAFGTGLGLFAAFYEEMLGTGPYLEHRPISLQTILLVRVMGCMFATLLVMLLPFLLQPLFLAPWSEVVEFQRYSRLFGNLGMATVCLSSFAVTYYGATLRCSNIMRLVIVGSLDFLIIVFSNYLACGTSYLYGKTSLSLYVVVQLAITLLFIVLALRQQKDRQDADIPVGCTRLYSIFLPVILPILVSVILFLSSVQEGIHSELIQVFPHIASLDSGEFSLIKWDSRRKNSFRTTPDHQWDQSSSRPVRGNVKKYYMNIFPGGSPLGLVWGREKFNGYWEPLGISTGEDRLVAWLHCPENQVWLFPESRNAWHPFLINRSAWGQRPIAKLGIGPENNRLAEGYPTHKHQGGDEIFWAKGGGVFIYHLDCGSPKPTLCKYELPNHDQLVSMRFPDQDNPTGMVVHGQEGVYTLKGNQLQSYSGPLGRKPAKGGIQKGNSVASFWKYVDPLSPTFEARGENGQTLYSHAFAPRTLTEKSLAFCMYVTSLLRPPVAQIYSALTTGSQAERKSLYENILIDPLLYGGRRLWYLFLHLGLTGVLFLLVWRRLKKLGADSKRIMFWSFLILTMGPVLWCLYRIIETQRSWRRFPIAKNMEPPLIQTSEGA